MFKTGKNLMFFSYLVIVTVGVLLGLNSHSWIMMWVAMEMTLMAFVPQMITGNSILESQSASKYFVFQCLGSAFFMLGCINCAMVTFMIYGCLVKLGVFPMHFWVLSVSKGLNWTNFFFLMTVQKILPLVFLMVFIAQSFYLFFSLIILNSIVGSIGSLNQNDLRSLMVYSSMNHLTWMVLAKLLSWSFFFLYFFVYSGMLLLLSFLFKEANIFYLNQLFYLNNYNHFLYVSVVMILFFSFLGFPPFLGFYLKILSIYTILSFPFFFVLVLLLMNAFITFSYLRVFYYMYMYNFRSVVKVSITVFYSPLFFILFCILV